jgi:GTP-binding protein HflX
VILDIFADHAHSAEGKMQVELAQLEYNMARMRGLWTHLERLGAGRGVGGIGTRGPGESQIETDRRLARDRIHALRRRLNEVRGHRAVQRAERERAQGEAASVATERRRPGARGPRARRHGELGVRHARAVGRRALRM